MPWENNRLVRPHVAPHRPTAESHKTVTQDKNEYNQYCHHLKCNKWSNITLSYITIVVKLLFLNFYLRHNFPDKVNKL